MKRLTQINADSRRFLAICAICVSSSFAHAADLARVDALLVQAQALLNAARTELTTNPTNDTNPEASGRIDLATFAWAGKKTCDPVGIPPGAKYGEGVEGGKRCCQWAYSDFVLHAWFPAGTKAITGTTPACRWYHFTTTPQPHPGLASWKWQNTHQTKDAKTGVLWYRWVGAK